MEKSIMKLILSLLILFSSITFIASGQLVITSVPVAGGGTRTKIVSTVNTLVCSFDNVGGATTTIHINCKVPLGYILVETTTPRFTPVGVLPPGTQGNVGASVGCFIDDNNNIVSWILQQLIRGIIRYQITDNTGNINTGDFTSTVASSPTRIGLAYKPQGSFSAMFNTSPKGASNPTSPELCPCCYMVDYYQVSLLYAQHNRPPITVDMSGRGIKGLRELKKEKKDGRD